MIESKRNSGLDLLRVMLMMGICLIHAVYQGGLDVPRWASLTGVFVPAFVVLSGWFGIRFSWRKFLGLIGVGVYATIVAVVGAYLVYQTPITARNSVLVFRDHWFLWTYLGLMLFAPTLNIIIELAQNSGYPSCKNARNAIGFIVFLFLLGSVAMIRNCPKFYGLPAGMSNNSLVSFICLYVITRIIRLSGVMKKVNRLFCILMLFVSIVGVIGLSFSETFSPFVLCISLILIMFFADLKMPSFLDASIRLLCPSLFFVYLVHSNKLFGFRFITDFESVLESRGVNYLVIYIVVMIVVFAVSIVLDLPRRIVVALELRREKIK